MTHKMLSSRKDQQRSKHVFDSKEDYEGQLHRLQKELLDVQQLVRRKKKKLIVVFEGVDASGKGGVIKRLTEYLDPHLFRVHATREPNAIEEAQNYMQRFFRLFPDEGTIAIFDRSWYGRVLVERVEGFAASKNWKRAFHEIRAIEKMLVDDGMIVLKYCLDISYSEQAVRFKERESDPLKTWKLTDDDWRNRAKWDAYHLAFRDMIENTSVKKAPWKVIAADSKWSARIEILKDVVKRSKALLRS